MQTNQLVFELIMNIGLMVLVASLLSKLQLVQDIICRRRGIGRARRFCR